MYLHGLDGILVNVEVDVSNGMPQWEIVGMPDASIRESKERIRTALRNCKIFLPSKKYIINLSPTSIRKEGANFDLSIAVGILCALGVLNERCLESVAFFGELSLDGKINKIKGALPLAIECKKNNISKLVLPVQNVREVSVLENIEIVGVSSLNDVIKYVLEGKTLSYNQNIEYVSQSNNLLDFSDVKGNEEVKRALEISAAGGHNILLIGSPGAGKTMLAKRFPTILPDLTFDESVEITKIHSVLGLLDDSGLVKERPFRTPHHSITSAGLIGGGKNPKPGEISLAHLGVLFLDELLEYKKSVIESLRMPLEDKKVILTRFGSTVTYPANFILIASTNPCPCGYLGSNVKKCVCTDIQKYNYISKLSGPMLDRFDMQVYVFPVTYSKLIEKNGESSLSIKERVNQAKKIQLGRFKDDNIFSNSEMKECHIEKYCKLNSESQKILEKSFLNLKLSARGYSKILKVSRTIADLCSSVNIETEHIMEALHYRNLFKGEKL